MQHRHTGWGLLLALNCLCLVLVHTTSHAAAWSDRLTVDSPTGNVNFNTVWDRSVGMHVRLEDPQGQKSVEITLGTDQVKVLSALSASDRLQPVEHVLFDPSMVPLLNMKQMDVILKLRPTAWTMYVRGMPVAQWSPPFEAPLKLKQPPSEIPAGADDAVWFQKTGDYVMEADFMVTEDQENPLGEWHPESGEWKIHTTVDNVEEADRSAAFLKRPPQAERSPNFYSLQGTGEDAIISYGYDFLDQYELSAAMQTKVGEVGLVFFYRGERDYYRLTIESSAEHVDQATVSLWGFSSVRMPRKRLLASCTVPVTPNQWVKPKIRAWDEHIECYLDGTRLFGVDEELTAGGKFGLYVNSTETVRFDDVSVRSVLELNLSNTDRIRFNTHLANGTWYKSTSFLGLFRQEAPVSNVVEPPRSATPKWLVIGSPSHGSHVFSATFKAGKRTDEVGVLTGYEGADTRYFRALYAQADGVEHVRLVRVLKGVESVVDEVSLPLPKTVDLAGTPVELPPVPVRLTVDPTSGSALRVYRNGELMLVHYPQEPVRGAAGLYLGGGVEAKIYDLKYVGQREGLYKNKYEKNRNYVIDPFMRHWSSPEGQWHEDILKRTWYKGDFFGRLEVNMPYVEGSVIHLGVDEDAFIAARKATDPLTPPAPDEALLKKASEDAAVQGQVIVRLAEGHLRLYTSAAADAKPVADVALPEAAIANSKLTDEAGVVTWMPAYAVHAEGHCLWVTSEGQQIAKLTLPEGLKGRRLRIEGFTMEQLAGSLVERYNVKDYLFDEAPTDWTRNGGTWEIVNRFQCDPRWSHMNAESADNLAAIWTKYRFSGDFSVEIYAGIRHGWYNRVGDVNLTIMNDKQSPSRGYSITATGWDNDSSQLWTTLYRNGEAIDKSDTYMMPRLRDGNQRRYMDPLIQSGRDVHGAWYYYKFRRIGDTLEYWFDDQLIFRRKEKPEEALNNGSFGLWTYMNSMVVARVKIAAEKIEPRTFEVGPANPIKDPDATLKADDLEVQSMLQANGQPVQAMLPENWESPDPVSFTRLTWHSEDSEPLVVATDTLGSGDFPLLSKLKPVPMDGLAGWRFQVKRTDAALFNFHYSVGTMADGKFVPQTRYVHVISGASTDDAVYLETSSSTVPATGPAGDANWYTQGDWTTVTVWLPMDRYPSPDVNRMVRVDGFGNFQPSFVMQGLKGNAPGEAYAIRGFMPIGYARPALTLNEERGSQRLQSMLLMDGDRATTVLRTASIQELAAHVSGDARDGLNLRRLRLITRTGRVQELNLGWLTLPAKPVTSVVWDSTTPGAVLIQGTPAYMDRRLATQQLTVGAEAVASQPRSYYERVAYLPRSDAYAGAAEREPTISGQLNGEAWSLKWADRPHERPVLLGIDGAFPYMINFEARTWPSALQADANRMTLTHADAIQGTYLDVHNLAYQQRLQSVFTLGMSLSKFPIMQLRYRMPVMGRVSLDVSGSAIAFTEPGAGAPVRYATTPRTDNEWHTWTGMVTDVNSGNAFRPNRFQPGNFRLASIAQADQSGARTRIGLDDIILGPAVRNAEALSFTPKYFDYDGIKRLFIEVRQGPQAYDELDTIERNDLHWTEVPVGSPIVPDLSKMKPGVCQIFIRAQDKQAQESAVTSLPFLYDNAPLEVKTTIANSRDPRSNGTDLRVDFNAQGGAPIQLETLAYSWNDKPVKISNTYNELVHTQDSTSFTLNWPYILASQLDGMKDGESGALKISSILDGAGNVTPDVVVPITINYAKDKIGPALLPQHKMPKNLQTTLFLDGQSSDAAHFEAMRNTTMTLVNRWNEEPYIQNNAYQTNGGATLRTPKWTLKEFPNVGFRVCRPVIADKDTMRLVMNVTLDNGKTYIVELTEQAGNQRHNVIVPDPFTWQKNVWQAVSMNLYQLMSEQAKLKQDQLDSAVVVSVELRRYNTQHVEPLLIQSFTVFAPWSVHDEITVQAYDASGVGSVKWDLVDATDKVLKQGQVDGLKVTPANLGLPATPHSWLKLYAVDKAGNASLPIRVPYMP